MIVHIGYPKTGTTFLQKNIFPHLEEMEYLNYQQSFQVFESLIHNDDLDYDVAAVRQRISTLKQSNKPLLLSLESLAGHRYMNGMNRSNIAKRLKELGATKTIVTIRRQADIIDSIYRHYIQVGGTMRLKDYLDLDRKIDRKVLLYFRPEFFDYYKLIKLYRKLFGTENVFVIIQEEMRKDTIGSLNHLLSFMGTSLPEDELKKHLGQKNASLSNFSLGLLRLINYSTYSPMRPSQWLSKSISTHKFRVLFQNYLDPAIFSRLSGKKNLLEKHGLKERVNDFYRESNRRLISEFNLAVDKYNYPT